MKLFIPPIGTKLKLIQPWTFHLYWERRNQIAFKLFVPDLSPKKVDWYGMSKQEFKEITLPIGTILSLDRIYIRKGSKAFDSLTFRMLEHPDMKKKKARFWAKLSECNQLDVEVVEYL